MSARRWAVAVGIVASLTGASGVVAQTITIGPGGSLEPGDPAAFFHGALLEGQGQTFVVPLGFPVLQEFRWLYGTSGQAPSITFELYAWDGTAPVGSALVSRVLPFAPVNGDPPVFTGALPLVEGQAYLALMVGDPNGVAMPGKFAPGQDPYPDGTFVYRDGTEWRTLIGRTQEGPYDTFFDATFGVALVPEPGTVVLLATGLLGVAALARRRG